jgi:lysophospholipase L1-like esterase
VRSVLTEALAGVVGALETAADADGVTFHRVPALARTRQADMFIDFMSATPSGVRIEALTDAASLELDVRLARALLPGAESPGTAFDVVTDGVLQAPVRATEETLIRYAPSTGGIAFEPAGATTVRLPLGTGAGPGGPDGAAGERRVEVWFPADATLSLADVRVPDGASFRPAPPAGPRWVHHGSSISQCMEADRPTGTWPAIAARAAGLSLVNLALGGQCQLDQFMARAIRDEPADVISLELGINVVNGDTMRERVFVPAVHGFLDTVRDGHPTAPLVVVTPIVCPEAEDRPGPTLWGEDNRVHTGERPRMLAEGALSLTRVRELLHGVVGVRRAEGDTTLHVVDGLALFGPDDVGDLPDGLHPNAAGYRRMGERFHAVALAGDGPLRPGGETG